MSSHRLYYGWVLVAALSLTETTSWGVLFYSFTVFVDPMQMAFGWSRTQVTVAFSLALVISAVMAIPVGRWLDRHGPRLLMSLGSVAAALLLLGWAAVQNLVQFYIIWILLGVVMAAVLYEPAFLVVAIWFRRRRAQALTALTLIAGLASVIFIPLAGALVAASGWRHALVALALVLATATILPHAIVLRRSPEAMGLRPDGTEMASADGEPGSEQGVPAHVALRGTMFWLLASAFLLNSLAIGVIFVHIVPLLTQRGLSTTSAAQAAGFIGLMALPGRLLLTPLGTRVPRGYIACVIFLLQGMATLVLLATTGFVGVAAFVVLFGMGFGAVTPARAALVADYYGAASYGAISGVLAFFVTVSRGIAPVAAAALYDVRGNYQVVLVCLTAASLLAAAIVLVAERTSATRQPAVV